MNRPATWHAWTTCEAATATELAKAKRSYAQIAHEIHQAGYPRRTPRAIAARLNELGVSNAAWAPDEDKLLEAQYRARLPKVIPGRSKCAIWARAKAIGIAPRKPNCSRA